MSSLYKVKQMRWNTSETKIKATFKNLKMQNCLATKSDGRNSEVMNKVIAYINISDKLLIASIFSWGPPRLEATWISASELRYKIKQMQNVITIIASCLSFASPNIISGGSETQKKHVVTLHNVFTKWNRECKWYHRIYRWRIKNYRIIERFFEL